jgi:cytochrome b561
VTDHHRSVSCYPVRTRILHWLTVVLILSALFVGLTMVNSIDSYASLVHAHMTLGVLVLSVAIVRVANRFTHRAPPLPDNVGPIEHNLIVGSAMMLYALMLAQPLVGWAMVSASGEPVVLVGSLRLPRIAPFSADLYFVLRQTHSVLAYTLVVLITAHVGMVLWHSVARRDGMLSRMTFSFRRRATVDRAQSGAD